MASVDRGHHGQEREPAQVATRRYEIDSERQEAVHPVTGPHVREDDLAGGLAAGEAPPLQALWERKWLG